MNIEGPTHKIYFLALDGRLPNWYTALSQYFSDYDINLVPIEMNDLKHLGPDRNISLIMSEISFYGNDVFDKAFSGFLGHIMKSGLYHIHHISSFAMSHEQVAIKRKTKKYYFYKMPFSINDFVNYVADKYFENLKNSTKWPGGKRAKLPTP